MGHKKRRESSGDEEDERRRKRAADSSSDSEASCSSDEDDRRRRRRERHKEKRRKERRKERKEKNKKKRKDRKDRNHRHRDDGTQNEQDLSDGNNMVEQVDPEAVAKEIVERFPELAGEFKQLLKMIDSGQGVDVTGIADESLRKLLCDLFRSLKLTQAGEAYCLPDGVTTTSETLASILEAIPDQPDINLNASNSERQDRDEQVTIGPAQPQPRSRVIGPAMPTPDMLAAAAKLSEAEDALRQAEEELAQDPFIGPPPPAIVAEVASANEAERFEEVARILDPEMSTAYQKLGVKHDATPEAIKKKYWKLSLMVHPDKCSHPQAQEAFQIINKAFNDLQDPTKRAAIDNVIAEKQRKEVEDAELRTLREAALWRRMRGDIALVGDDELLGTAPRPPERDEWMTNLPPERQAGRPTMQSTFFSKSEKTGRGDTSVWTDTPLEKAEKAKTQYLEAYKQAALPKPQEDLAESQRSSQLASIVDKYNEKKRSESLVEKHQREAAAAAAAAKKKSTKSKKEAAEVEEWAGKHPWKPWDREKDLVAGRKPVKLDAASMGQGLTSRFSSGGSQRKFL